MPPASKRCFDFTKIHHIRLLFVFLSVNFTCIYYYLYLDVKFKYVSQPYKKTSKIHNSHYLTNIVHSTFQIEHVIICHVNIKTTTPIYVIFRTRPQSILLLYQIILHPHGKSHIG
jgi:hypothetical protein